MGILDDVLEHSELMPSQLLAYVDQYESIQPYDCMIDTARAVANFWAQDYKKAEEWILSAIRKNPANYMNHLYYGLISEASEQYFVAAIECWTAAKVVTQFGEPPDAKRIEKQINDVLARTISCLSKEELKQFDVSRNILESPGSFFPAYYLYSQRKWSRFHGGFLYFDPSKNIMIIFVSKLSLTWMESIIPCSVPCSRQSLILRMR